MFISSENRNSIFKHSEDVTNHKSHGFIYSNTAWILFHGLKSIQKNVSYSLSFYASPSSEEAYRDRRRTTNFDLWVEIICVPTCFHMRISKPCLSVCPSVYLSVCPSVCPYPEKRNHPGFVNISPTLVIDTSMERFSRVLHHGNPKIWI